MASSAMRSGTGKYQITAITDAAGKMGAGDSWTMLSHQEFLVGGLEHEFYDFPYIKNNHPN
jgi:hypothetical protein